MEQVKTALPHLFRIGLITYHASRFAYCSGLSNSIVESALRFSPLLGAPVTILSAMDTIKTLSDSRVVNKKEFLFHLLINSLSIGWSFSTAFIGEAPFSGISTHLYSAGQISLGGLTAWNAHRHGTAPCSVERDLGRRLFGPGSIPANFLLIVPFLINTPLLSQSFCPRFSSALAIVNIGYRQFNSAQTAPRRNP